MGKITALVKTKTQAQAVNRQETELTLVKPALTHRRETTRNRSFLWKIKSIMTGGQQAIRRGAKSSSTKTISAMTSGQQFVKRGVWFTVAKTGAAVTSGQRAIIGGYLAVQGFFKKKPEKEQEQQLNYSLFLLITLVVVAVDREIFFGEFEGQLTIGWLGFCLGWFVRDKTTSRKARFLFGLLISLIAIIKWSLLVFL